MDEIHLGKFKSRFLNWNLINIMNKKFFKNEFNIG